MGAFARYFAGRLKFRAAFELIISNSRGLEELFLQHLRQRLQQLLSGVRFVQEHGDALERAVAAALSGAKAARGDDANFRIHS